MLRTQIALSCIQERAEGRCDAEPTAGFDVALSEVCPVQDGSVCPFPESFGHGEVDLPGHDVTELMNRKRGIVGDNRPRDAGAVPAPERPADQVLVRRGWVVWKAEHAALDLQPVPALAVEVLQAITVAALERLSGREVAALRGGNGAEASFRLFRVSVRHARKLHAMECLRQ